MKRAIIGGLIAAVLPGAAFAHNNIGVRVSLSGGSGWGEEEAWIEFEAERDAFVAVYATFSDGSFELVFPTASGESHWVDGRESYAVPVLAPYGEHVQNVQAVASAEWFDPSECWLAFDDGPRWRTRVLVATAYPVWSWGFSFAWSSSDRCWNEVRRVDWYAPRCEAVYRIDRSRFRSWDRWDDRPFDRRVQSARSPSVSKAGT